MPQIRVERVLGASMAMLDEHALRVAVDNRVREDVDLDFKKALYGPGDSAKHALAADVAAMANTVGGVIIIGIRDEEAVAVEATPVPLSEDEELRMYQVAANLVTPAPALSIRRVHAVNESEGYIVLDIPRSAAAPHAVRVNQNLRYPRRYGTTTVYMSESDVADAYRNRFAAAAGQVDRVRAIHDDGVDRLDLKEVVWGTVALVPSITGEFRIRQPVLHEFRDWIDRRPRAMPAPATEGGISYSYAPRAALRRVVLSADVDRETGLSSYGHAELHTDGSAFVAMHAGWNVGPNSLDENPESLHISDENLVGVFTRLIDIAADHALSHARAAGDGAVRASLLLPEGAGARLAHNRSMFARTYGSTLNASVVTEHTIDLEAVGTSVPELLSATYLVVNDLVQALGQPEPLQITPSGEVRWRYIGDPMRNRVKAWAETQDVAVVETSIEQEA